MTTVESLAERLVYRRPLGLEMGDAEVEELMALIEASFERWPNNEISVPNIEHLSWKLKGPNGRGEANLVELDGRMISGGVGWDLAALIRGVRAYHARRRRLVHPSRLPGPGTAPRHAHSQP